MTQLLRPFWTKFFIFGWKLGLFLILLFGAPRFYLVLKANINGQFNLVSYIFILMWISPFILLNRQGRRAMGIRLPASWFWLFLSIFVGMLICAVVFMLGGLFYADSIQNWFVYIAQSYQTNIGEIKAEERMVYFIIFSLISMTFSPIGEELFYRGVVHESFVPKFGVFKASLIDSLAFGITHLAHFGIIYYQGEWQFVFVPAILWVILMTLTGMSFYYCRMKTGSILGAIFSHAGFNLAMNYFIFYHILN